MLLDLRILNSIKILTDFLQLEQNSSTHVGHLTATAGTIDIKEPD